MLHSCRVPIAVVLSLLVTAPAMAAWQRDGIPIAPPSRAGHVGSDGAGGLFVGFVPIGGFMQTWNYYQVWALRRLADGAIAPSWPDTGVMLANTFQSGELQVQSVDDLIPDGAGGVFVLYQPYVPHLVLHGLAHTTASDADMSGWPVTVANGPYVRVALNDDGGVLYALNGYDPGGSGGQGTYLKRRRANGSVGGTQQSAATPGQVAPTIDTDHQGGAIACWQCQVQGVDSTMANVWFLNWPGCSSNLTTVSDGVHGAYLAWISGSTLRVTRITSEGDPAPGWTQAGIAAGIADGFSASPTMELERDEVGGLFVRWDVQTDTRVQRVTGAGAIASGWAAAGVPVAPRTSGTTNPPSEIVPDGAGGLYIAWSEMRNTTTGADIYAQHVASGGVPAAGWLSTGDPICTAMGSQTLASASTDGAGGVYFGWLDTRSNSSMYGQHLTATDTIPLAVPPRAPAMALGLAVRTNPSTSGIVCFVTLPTADAARLEVFDTAGRRVSEQVVRGAAAGTRIATATSEVAKPGVYLIRVTQAGLTASTRAVVIQ